MTIDPTTMSTDQLIHAEAAIRQELRRRTTDARQRKLMQAKETFLDSAAVAPAAGSMALGFLGKAASHIQQIGRDFRRG